jgi:hypothetical protein
MQIFRKLTITTPANENQTNSPKNSTLERSGNAAPIELGSRLIGAVQLTNHKLTN